MRTLLPVLLTLLACSSTPASPTDAGGAEGGHDAGAASPDASLTPDAFTATDGGSIDAAAGGDAGACADHYAQCPRPPAGYTRCGGGAIDAASARPACDALDPPSDLGMGLMKACDAFTLVSGHYEVWCGPTDVYVWASVDELTSSDVLTCSFSVPLPDGGAIGGSTEQLSWGLSDTNDMLYGNFTLTGGGGRAIGMLSNRGWPYASSDRAVDSSHWTGSVAFDGTVGTGAGVTGGSGNLFLTAAQDDCDGVPTSMGFRVVLAVPIVWP